MNYGHTRVSLLSRVMSFNFEVIVCWTKFNCLKMYHSPHRSLFCKKMFRFFFSLLAEIQICIRKPFIMSLINVEDDCLTCLIRPMLTSWRPSMKMKFGCCKTLQTCDFWKFIIIVIMIKNDLFYFIWTLKDVLVASHVKEANCPISYKW